MELRMLIALRQPFDSHEKGVQNRLRQRWPMHKDWHFKKVLRNK